MEAVRALAIWEIYTHYISGRNHEGSCHTIDRLNAEAGLTNKLLKLLTAKRRLIGGEGIEHLSPQALEDLDAICQRGLRNILERQFQVRIKAPRYTSSVHPALLPEGCDDAVARVSHALDMPERNSLEKRRRKSTSFQLLKGSVIIREKKDRGSLEGKGLLLSDYLSKSEGPRALGKLVADVGPDKDHTILEVEDEPEEADTESDDLAELEEREAAEVESSTDDEHSRSNPLEHLSRKGVQKQALQKSLEVWMNSAKEEPPSSPPDLQKPVSQEPPIKREMSITEQQPPKSPPISQKRVSFSQPEALEADSRSQSSTGTSPREPLTNDSKPSLGATLEASSSPTLSAAGPNNFQLLTRPQWVQVRPQTFNIIGPASIHTHVGGVCSTQAGIAPHVMQGIMQPRDQQSPPIIASKSKASKEQSPRRPLGDEESLFDRSMQIDLYKSGEDQCAHAAASKVDQFWPRDEQNFPAVSVVDRHSLREEQGPQVGFRTDRRSLRKEQDPSVGANNDRRSLEKERCPPIGSGVDRYSDPHSLREEQGPQVGSRTDRRLLRNAQDLAVGANTDRRSLREEQSPPTGSRIDRHLLREELGFQAGSSPDRRPLRKEQDPALVPKTDRRSLREERSPSTGSVIGRHSLREEQGPQVGSSTDRRSLRKEQDPTVGPKFDRRSLREEHSPPSASGNDQHSLQEEPGFQVGKDPDGHLVRKEHDPLVEPKTDRRSLRKEQRPIVSVIERHSLREEEQGPQVGSCSDRRSLRKEQDRRSQEEERSPSIGSGIDRHSLREESDFQVGSCADQRSLREEQDPLFSPRIGRQSLSGEEEDGILNRLRTNRQSSQGEEERSIPIQSITDRQSLGEEQRPLFVSTIDRQSLREEDDRMIPIRPGIDRRSLREELGLPDRHSQREQQGLPIGSRTAPRQSVIVGSVVDRHSLVREAPSPHPAGSRADQRSTLRKEQSPPPDRERPRPAVAVASKSGGYIEAIIPPRLRALFQKMQPKPRNEYIPPRSDHASPSAVIVTGTKREHHASPPRLPPSVVSVSTPPTTSTFPEQKSDHHHVKWRHPPAESVILSLTPQKWTKPRGESILGPPPAFRQARPQSDMQHLLRSHPNAKNTDSPTGSPLLRAEKVHGRQSPRVQCPRYASHRCSKRHHSFHQHLDRAPYDKRSGSPHEFRRVPHTQHANQHQTKQAQPQRCSDQCEHHHHQHSTCRLDQEEDHYPPGFHCNRTPGQTWNIAGFEGCNDGWFSPAHPSEKCPNRPSSDRW